MIFYSITPLFKFKLEPNTSVLSYTGTHKDAQYEIKIVNPKSGSTFFEELMPWADEKTVESCKQIHLPPGMLGGAADFFLTIDVEHKDTKKLKVAANTLESVEIGSAMLDALRLVSSKGLLYYNTYHFRSIPIGRSTGSPLIDQYIFSRLGSGPSVLDEADFTSCQSIFESLLNEKQNSDEDSDKLLELAMSYHQVVFKLEKVQHSFLILMIIFESMFKKGREKNIANASRRIGQVLGNTSQERKSIEKEFNGSIANTFGKLRNKIAHGDSSLDIQVVKDKYPKLYAHVTRAIIKRIEEM